MNKLFRPWRLAVFAVFFLGTLSVYSVVLYKMQIYDPARELPADAAPPPTTTRVETIRAARGDIMDRNGETLVTSRVTYDIVLTRTAMRAAGNINDTIRELLRLKSDAGVAHADTFPITPGAPYEYRYDMTAAQRARLNGYLEFHDLDAGISAADLIVWLKKHYDIPYTVGVAEARLIIGVRFELETRAITELRVFSQYVFAEDIPRELASRISERAFPGVSVVTGSRREFVSSSAAHLLGYTGKMDAADFEKYEELGYPMDAVIGKSGAEAAFEAYLHGTDGAKTIRTAADGTVISEEITAQPVPGANVNLTIDYKLQLAAERALADKIQLINLEREEKERVTGGAVAVTQVKTGEVLALASYPSFDAVTRLGDEFNRATQGRYNPGSTIKMATALAGMRAGVISRYTKIEDKGIYTEHSSFQPRCWLYTQSFGGATHGYLDVVEALTVSCNYFFYVVGNDARPTAMAAAAHDFGLGDPTGIEIKEDTGLAATPEYVREVLNDLWYDGTTLLAAIGQGHSVYTPLQLANYAATIAGGGVLRDVTLLRSVKTYDYSGALYEHTPHTRSTVPEGDLVEILKEGMRSAVTSGTAYSAFGNYPVPVAAKTGTVQVGDAINNGVFVCYAPANDPEIAISVVVEKGSSGAEIMEIARVVMDEYFNNTSGYAVVGDGELLP